MSKRKTHDQIIAVIGYGSQGRAMALNLRDSGYDIIVGLRARSGSRRQATDDGLIEIETVRTAVTGADVVCFAFPDHLHGRVYERDIKGRLKSGTTLLFLAGMSVHFSFVTPPGDCDVIMIAPHAPGVAVREQFLTDRSLSAFYAVHQDATGQAAHTAQKLAEAIGFLKNRLVRTTFEHEALGDLFGEQAVLCGGLAMLLKLGFETLLKKGLPPENAYLEVVHQMDLLVDLVKKHGIEGMLSRISVAARYGSVQAGPEIFDEAVEKRMEHIYDRIASGEFPEKLNKLTPTDIAKLKKGLKKLSHPLLEKYARKYSDS